MPAPAQISDIFRQPVEIKEGGLSYKNANNFQKRKPSVASKTVQLKNKAPKIPKKTNFNPFTLQALATVGDSDIDQYNLTEKIVQGAETGTDITQSAATAGSIVGKVAKNPFIAKSSGALASKVAAPLALATGSIDAVRLLGPQYRDEVAKATEQRMYREGQTAGVAYKDTLVNFAERPISTVYGLTDDIVQSRATVLEDEIQQADMDYLAWRKKDAAKQKARRVFQEEQNAAIEAILRKVDKNMKDNAANASSSSQNPFL